LTLTTKIRSIYIDGVSTVVVERQTSRNLPGFVGEVLLDYLRLELASVRDCELVGSYEAAGELRNLECLHGWFETGNSARRVLLPYNKIAKMEIADGLLVDSAVIANIYPRNAVCLLVCNEDLCFGQDF
jgi:hypothetical protein